MLSGCWVEKNIFTVSVSAYRLSGAQMICSGKEIMSGKVAVVRGTIKY